MNKKTLRKIQNLCLRFSEDLQKIFDEDMDEETYEHEICQSATSAQGYADDAGQAEI